MVDWAPSSRVALMQQLSVLTASSLHEESSYRQSVGKCLFSLLYKSW